MARRKQFKGVANNLSQWCLSRNNDFQGYWAIGQIYSLAKELHLDEITYDVLRNQFTPGTHKFNNFGEVLFKVMSNCIDQNDISWNWLKEVAVTFKFDVEFQHKYHFYGSALGTPFLCVVEITSDLGKTYKGVGGCNIRPHNPIKEGRRGSF
jgi:hypothetical protein